MSNGNEKTQGLTCPNCRGDVPVPEGVRIVRCPYCEQRSLVQGERGIRRWQVTNKIQRDQATSEVKDFFRGIRKARDLKTKAQIQELFLVYLPYWRVTAFVTGWLFGRVKRDKDSTKPVEVQVMETMHWNDAATDVSEFGVHRVSIAHQDLEPFDSEWLHREAMIFEPSESRSEAMTEAEQYFTYVGQTKRRLTSKYFEKFHFLRPQFSLVYYPLWVARYEYQKRNYQVVVDGVKGKVLYGKAPGNIFFRAAALVAGMAIGNLVLVNGTILSFFLASGSSDDDGGGLFIVPLILGIAVMIAGYRAFRYGEEVEQMKSGAKKALGGGTKSIMNQLKSGKVDFQELASEVTKGLPK